ncbi:DUF192 domain-containing protein [Leptodesmis sp.]|uniref:DUF192 domain-containing protein n=1 Tax=Leptodesmis sp. TaxID=3100501 RepID=UPI0040534A47
MSYVKLKMQSALVGSMVLASLLAPGCASVPAVSSTTSPIASQTTGAAIQAIAMGQILPISAQIKVGDQTIGLEVAKTEQQQEMGLMYRKQLEDNRGMLFPFHPPRPVGFWMKNCLISLDMVFLRNGQVVAIAHNAPPCQKEPCPVYGPPVSVDQVIELRGGRAKELGIKAGDRLVIQFTNYNSLR